MRLVIQWTDDVKSTTGNKKGLPELSQPQEPTYLTSTTALTSEADAQESEIHSQSRGWQGKAEVATARQEMEEVIAHTFGHASIHHCEDFAKGS